MRLLLAATLTIITLQASAKEATFVCEVTGTKRGPELIARKATAYTVTFSPSALTLKFGIPQRYACQAKDNTVLCSRSRPGQFVDTAEFDAATGTLVRTLVGQSGAWTEIARCELRPEQIGPGWD